MMILLLLFLWFAVGTLVLVALMFTSDVEPEDMTAGQVVLAMTLIGPLGWVLDVAVRLWRRLGDQ